MGEVLKIKRPNFWGFQNFKITIENETRRKIKALKFVYGKYTLPKSLMNFTIMTKWKKRWFECIQLNKMEFSKEKQISLGNS